MHTIHHYVLHFQSRYWKKAYLDVIRKAKSISKAKKMLSDYAQIDGNALTSFLESGAIKVNDVLAIPYFDYKDHNIEKLLPFIVYKVEDGHAFCHCLVSIRAEAINKNGSNNYGTSNIRKILTKLVGCFDSNIASHFRTNKVSWVHPLSDKEMIFKDKFWLLDFAELYTHFKTAESRKRIYLSDGEASNWWLRTAIFDTDDHGYIVHPSGASYNHFSRSFFGLVPACIIG